MRLVDARRITGPSHLSRSPVVVVELALDGEVKAPLSLDSAVALYRGELTRMRAAVGLASEVSLLVRAHRGGAVIGYAAPIDVMLACAEISEWAALSAIERSEGRAALSLEPKRAEIAAMLARDASPALLALESEARRRDLPFLWDDELVSVGSGPGALVFARHEVPGSIAWGSRSRIPVALVTGTNGKTTSSRLVARMAAEAGLRVALTSTDGVAVGSETLEDGDWTGPGAARLVLRRADVDLAVLETARGGILRRGLGVDTCDGALVTNVGADHLGHYGIDDVDAMAEVKGVVAHAVRASGTVVLNARDPRLVALADRVACAVTFFADLDAPDSDAARAVVAAGRAKVVVAEGGVLVAPGLPLLRIEELPLTFGGAARYNVENMLGAVGLGQALGVPATAIASALRGFGMADNPGRGQVVVVRGVTVILDFGHNAEGVRAVLGLVASLRGSGRLFVATGSPGDRSDAEIAAIARAVQDMGPHAVYVRELSGYARGRAPGEVAALFVRAFDALQARVVDSEVSALQHAFAQARPGDVVLVLTHLDHDAVQTFLSA